MRKTAKYIIVIVLLLGVNLWLFFSDHRSNTSQAQTYFLGEDIDQVSKFLFTDAEDTVEIALTGDGWIINDQYLADQNFINTLISVLRKVEVRRNVGDWKGSILGNAEIEFAFNSRYRFQYGSNPTKTKSYFIVNGVAKEVVVPGYRDQVIDLFDLHPDQWRDRLIFDGSWRTIQVLKVTNNSNDNFQIVFDDQFFKINDEAPQDSSSVVAYLNQFQSFQANEMISPGRFIELDSLAKTQPMATVEIEDIKFEYTIKLEVFPSLSGQRFHLVKQSDSINMVIDARRMSQILTNPDPVN